MTAQLATSGRYRSWMSYIRDFGRWLRARGQSDAYVLSDQWKARSVPVHPYLLTQREIEAFFGAAAQLDTSSPWRWQAVAFFALMHSCEIRTGEARGLLAEHVDLSSQHIDVLWSKEKRSRRLPVTDELAEVLAACDDASSSRFGHRERTDDPLYRARRLLTMAGERLDEKSHVTVMVLLRAGDTKGHVGASYNAKEAIRGLYCVPTYELASQFMDELIRDTDNLSWSPEVRSLGRALKRWQGHIIAWHQAHFTNAPSEAANNLIKKTKRTAFSFRSFRNFRVRSLLYAGKPNWDLLATITPRQFPKSRESGKAVLLATARRNSGTSARDGKRASRPRNLYLPCGNRSSAL